jgi:hypothetical protein
MIRVWPTSKRTLLTLLGLALLGALMTTLKEGRETGFFVLGGVFTMGTALLAEEFKRNTKAQDVALALHVELSQLVARCCFDFNAPWSAYYKNPTASGMNAERVRKFSPNVPVIYPAMAAEIALLGAEAARPLVEFHTRLRALQRAIDEAAQDQKYVGAVATRMRHALPPGLKALIALGSMIDGAARIEDDAFAALGVALGKPAPALGLRAAIQKVLHDYPAKM